MKKDGQLTKKEAQVVCKGLGILAEWLTAHQNDEHMPYGFWDLYTSHREMSNAVWIAFAK